MASEDIGNADPRGLQLAMAAWDAYDRLGSPEGELALAQAVLYLASVLLLLALAAGCIALLVLPYLIRTTQVALGGLPDDLRLLGVRHVHVLEQILQRLHLRPYRPESGLSLAARGFEVVGVDINEEAIHGGTGEDVESGAGDLRMWWYQVRFDGTEPIRSIDIRNEILYEEFEDQRNIVRVLHVPTDMQHTLYFAAPDGGWTELTW